MEYDAKTQAEQEKVHESWLGIPAISWQSDARTHEKWPGHSPEVLQGREMVSLRMLVASPLLKFLEKSFRENLSDMF
jgi:hypothetical protein